MAETTNKYLDIAGVRTLWGAIKTADDNLASELSARGASIEYDEVKHQIVLKKLFSIQRMSEQEGKAEDNV